MEELKDIFLGLKLRRVLHPHHLVLVVHPGCLAAAHNLETRLRDLPELHVPAAGFRQSPFHASRRHARPYLAARGELVLAPPLSPDNGPPP
eukprot:CAMPEP_0172646938 /NCGR_PEP_ID=MMETSP1068-20121228/240497_1 /TAXON_ID=35684 /ORGANISM="Pseudopedinella elastica, Strain CCMP716" /LENGTH=90 /DNA_ID=CAMNT_0013461205 /DNA_START=851 /DNA_END=1119 /DNA_ORIENTATION=+